MGVEQIVGARWDWDYGHVARLAGLAARHQLASPSPADQPAACPQQSSSLATGETNKNAQGMPRVLIRTTAARRSYCIPSVTLRRFTPATGGGGWGGMGVWGGGYAVTPSVVIPCPAPSPHSVCHD